MLRINSKWICSSAHSCEIGLKYRTTKIFLYAIVKSGQIVGFEQLKKNGF